MRPKRLAITPWNLPSWGYKTVAADIYFYRRLRRARRPLSWARIRSFPKPNLRNPIFVIGAARSGTTFLGNSLGVLPEISYHHEPVVTKAAAQYLYRGEWSEEQAGDFFRMVYRWLMRIYLDGDLRFAEKTPRNAIHVDFLVRQFPDAKFLHIVRDGRASALSGSKKPWMAAGAYQQGKKITYEPGGEVCGPFPRFWVEPNRAQEFLETTDIHRNAWAWRRLTEAAIDGLRNASPDRVLNLKYEELVTEPDAHADRILDFLDITASASRARFREALGQAHVASVSAWRDEITPEQLADVEREAGPLLRQLGYE